MDRVRTEETPSDDFSFRLRTRRARNFIILYLYGFFYSISNIYTVKSSKIYFRLLVCFSSPMFSTRIQWIFKKPLSNNPPSPPRKKNIYIYITRFFRSFLIAESCWTYNKSKKIRLRRTPEGNAKKTTRNIRRKCIEKNVKENIFFFTFRENNNTFGHTLGFYAFAQQMERRNYFDYCINIVLNTTSSYENHHYDCYLFIHGRRTVFTFFFFFFSVFPSE